MLNLFAVEYRRYSILHSTGGALYRYLLYSFPGLGLAGGADLPEGGRQLLQQGVQLVLAQLKLLTRHDPDHGGS